MKLWQILLIIACVLAFSILGLWGIGFVFEDIVGTLLSWLQTAVRWFGQFLKSISIVKF